MLILRHLMPSKEEVGAGRGEKAMVKVQSPGEGDSPMASVAKGATGKAALSMLAWCVWPVLLPETQGAATGWLCRLGALRDLCKAAETQSEPADDLQSF